MRGNIDEGMKKISYHIFSSLHSLVNVRLYDPLDFIVKWQEIRMFRPHIIHHLTGPSIFSLILLWIANTINKHSKTIITVSHPHRLFSRTLISLFRPRLVLVQSKDMKIYFSQLGIETKYFPNGVNLKKFQPVAKQRKIQLRKKMGFDTNKFIVLHVGNLRRGRNLRFIQYLAKNLKNFLFIVVSSTSIKPDNNFRTIFDQPNMFLISHFVKKIEVTYQIADCYVFTVQKRPYAIDLPLSIFEAAACNLPIVTTRYGGISAFFKETPFFIYIKTAKEMVDKLIQLQELLLTQSQNLKNREIVIYFDWDELAKSLLKLYNKIL